MSDPIKSAGWDIELIRCNHLEPKGADYAVFAVNLIVPRAAKEDTSKPPLYWVDGVPPPICTGQEAVDSLGELLRPWQWKDVSWKLYASADGVSGWTQVNVLEEVSGVWPVENTTRDRIRDSLVLELDARTEGCEEAFSIDSPRWQGTSVESNGSWTLGDQSWPHALAALTHTPAGLSNDVLRVARFFRVRAADIAANPWLVAFPELSIGGSPFVIDVVMSRKERLAAFYKTQWNGVTLVMGSEPIQGLSNLRALNGNLKEGRRGRGVIDRLFAAHLLPLEVLSLAIQRIDYSAAADTSIIDASPFPREAWLLALLNPLGAGWLRLRARPPKKEGDDPTSSRPHFLQYAFSGPGFQLVLDAYEASPATLSAKLEAAFGPVSIGKAVPYMGSLLDKLAKRTSLDPTAFEQMRHALEDPIKDLPANPDEKTKIERRASIQAFFGSWNVLANELLGDERGPLLGDWIRSLVEAQATGPLKTLLEKVAGGIEALDYDSADQLLLGALDSAQTSSKLWAALDGFVKAPTESDEKAAWKAIQSEIETGVKALAPSAKLPSKLQQALDDAGKRFLDDFALQGRRSGVRNHDEGLWLEFESNAPTSATVDAQIRGFSLALCGGVRSKADTLWWDKTRAQWITQTAIRHYWKEQNATKADLMQESRSGTVGVAWYAGTVGSSQVNGQRIGQVLYTGAPIFSVQESAASPLSVDDREDIKTLDYRWPIDASVPALIPLLGYGMEFLGRATAIDNAGGISEESLRDTNPYFAVLKPANTIPWGDNKAEETIRYESRVPPGAPRLLAVEARTLDGALTSVDPTELTDETRAVRYLSSKLNSVERPDLQQATDLVLGVALPRVASLVHGAKGSPNTNLFLTQAPASVTLRFRPPLTYVGFVQAWLATDRVILDSSFNGAQKGDLISDRIFKDYPDQLDTFRQKMSDRPTALCDYHPAVTAIGMELYYPATKSFEKLRPAPIARTVWDGNEIQLATDDVRLRIEVDEALTEPKSKQPAKADDPWILSLPPATFVRIRAYSLVKNDFFAATSPTNAHMRFAASVGKDEDASSVWAGYRAFGPSEYWAESMPRWGNTTQPAPETDYLPIHIDAPVLANAVTTRLVLAPSSKLSADWIRAVELFRHSWHWTGYPVQFPPVDDATVLGAWLPAFAGVESKRQRDVVELPTYVEGGDWRYGSRAPAGNASVEITLSEHRTSDGERPSRYAAYSVQPIVRFSSWLAPGRKPDQKWPGDLEQDLFAAGNLILGMGEYAETKRLPVPAFRYHIPLTATYSYDPAQSYAAIKLSRDNNGNLLIFEDSIRRTDDFSKIGGIGDTIEVDLLQTRSVNLGKKPASPQQDWPRRELFEIGPNPIFHPAPGAGLDTEAMKKMPQLAIEVSEPHGLTFDLVRNAKVAQTAVTVRPAIRRDVDGNPIDGLEEALRQWTLAKVRVRRVILPETQLDSVRTSELPWRIDGLDRIPADFAVDGVAEEGARSLKLKLGTETYDCVVPQVGKAGSRVRWLVSFHKGRWDPKKPTSLPGPYWAPQILVQVPRKYGERPALGWDTVEQSTCYGKEAWEWRDGQLTWAVSGLSNYTVRVVQMSDYTDARWLLFMGRIPGTDKTRPDQYALVPRVDAKKKVTSLVVTGGTFGSLQRPPQSPDEWKRPIAGANVVDVEFYVLFVSSSTSNVIAGRAGTEDVTLLAFQPSATPNVFVPLGPLSIEAKDLEHATGLLCGFQRISSTSEAEREVRIDSLDALMRAIFPDPIADADVAQRYPESLVRPTGSHWGPMPIVQTDD